MKKQKPKDSVTFVKERADDGTDWGILRQVQINRAFYSGFQWISWDNTNKRVYVPDLRPGEKRLTFNKIKPAVKTLLAKISKNRAKLEVNPDTNDIERIEVAKAGLKYLTYQWDADNMDGKSRLLKFYMILDGFPALKVYVDKNKGQDIPLNEELTEEIGDVPTKTGVIVTQVLDQFSLKIDPNAKSIDEIKWAIEVTPMDVDEIEEIWGKEVEPEGNITVRQTFDLGFKQDPKKYDHHAMVYDYWEWPCTKYPNGRRIVIAGDRELFKDENDPGENPFIFFPADLSPGSALATGLVTDMTTPQRSYNIKRTAEARILEEMGNPMWTIPINTVEDEDEITNEIGGFLHYIPTNNAKPERVQGATVDAGWQNAMERDEADMEDISGAHEISQGATPRGNNTLGGLQLQLEQDETKIALLVQSYEDGIKKWGEKVLRLVKKHFPEEQQLSIVGENGQIEAFTFSGADLSGKEVVNVVPGSSMPTLKAVQDDKIMSMYSAGMFNNPNTGTPDTRKVVRMLGESIASQYFDDSEQDENKALMEQRMWQQAFSDPQAVQALMGYMAEMQQFQLIAQQSQIVGLQPPNQPQPPVKLPMVRDFYDHEVHIMAHNRFRKSDDYDELPPQLQAIIDQHVAEHQQYLMAPQIQAQMQQQAAMEQQAKAQQQQTEAQAQEADKKRQHEQTSKMQDHYNKMEQDAQKGNMALQLASMRGGSA